MLCFAIYYVIVTQINLELKEFIGKFFPLVLLTYMV